MEPTLEIDVPTLLTKVFHAPASKESTLRKLLLQCGMKLDDLFVIDHTKGTAIAKDKARLCDDLIYHVDQSKKRFNRTKKHRGGEQ